MLAAATRPLLERSTAVTMGVSQEQQCFALSDSESARGIYHFVFSASGRRNSDNGHSESNDYETVTKTGGPVEDSPGESPTSCITLNGLDRHVATAEDNITISPEPSQRPQPLETETQAPCVRPKYGTTIVGLPDQLTAHSKMKSDKPRKKKKWRTVGAEELGFKLTLFPRVPVVDELDMKREEEVFMAIEAELEIVHEKVRPFQHLLQLEGAGLRKEEKLLRRDRDRREEKAHKQVKSKNITSVLNNRGRKTLYIHFRLYKLHPFLHCSNLMHPNLPGPPKRGGVCLDVARSAVKAQERASHSWGNSSSPHRRQPPQNLAHALDVNNAATELPADIVSFLISIQHREMTPEDYEMLLRLDDSVAPKTVSTDVISAFKTDTVNESTVGGTCSVCMEPYEVGQQRKFLPCEHVFHVQCIDMWLTNSSPNCPLDGLPIS